VATEVILPRLGQGMESGTIVRWLKSEGEPVEKGEPLFELDTDKVTQEVEAEAAGVLLKIAVAEGEVPVGQTVAFIGCEGEDVPEAAAAETPQEEAQTEAKPSEPKPEPAQEAAQRRVPPERPRPPRR
jgi:pyruvate/2-oxoglutarate dehydrogenase complex dihydrolipoamide acyltransferase (E2) component